MSEDIIFDGGKVNSRDEKMNSKPGGGTPSADSSSHVEETSRKSYRQLVENGEIGEQCQKVKNALDAMDYFPTIDELANEPLAGWQKSTISGRLNDLKDAGVVTDLKGEAKRESKYSGIKSKVWMVTEE